MFPAANSSRDRTVMLFLPYCVCVWHNDHMELDVVPWRWHRGKTISKRTREKIILCFADEKPECDVPLVCHKRSRFRDSKTSLVWLWSHMNDLPLNGKFILSWVWMSCSQRETFVLFCHCYLWPNSAVKRFMAVTCTHSYSFVSIETLSPGQACFFELHKLLPVTQNTHRFGYSHLTGFLFLGFTFSEWRKYMNLVWMFCAIFSCKTALRLIARSLTNMFST